ncbi:uncharacterized protein LAESUDRAFT_802173 [Laetiporus sulphureus 93-53]|uniref:Uncharacterized protein n=1 Tax=Laetiporus sulphureus 93-53 TaxID=1314785 RepID=A0A165FPK0_9APHY|nr:uncharacterized protein LAESUDRAFT_802173 [Laetiporus sulphureus 93-53]KZT09282.1 hypothetical protein LAESUDRAFT_802173 [Laetiporus sulphureus 93-53]
MDIVQMITGLFQQFVEEDYAFAAIEQPLASLQEHYMVLTSELHQAVEENQKLKATLESVGNAKMSVEDDLVETKKCLEDTQLWLRAAKEQLKTLKSQLASFQADREELEQDIKTRETEISAAQSAMEDRLRVLQIEKQSLESEQIRLLSDLDDKMAELLKEQQTLTQLEETLSAVREEKQKLEDEVSHATACLEAKATEADEERSARLEIENDYDALIVEKQELDIAHFCAISDVKNKEVELERLRQLRGQMEEALEEKNAEAENERVARTALERQQAALREENAQLRMTLDAAAVDRESLFARIADLERRISTPCIGNIDNSRRANNPEQLRQLESDRTALYSLMRRAEGVPELREELKKAHQRGTNPETVDETLAEFRMEGSCSIQ